VDIGSLKVGQAACLSFPGEEHRLAACATFDQHIGYPACHPKRGGIPVPSCPHGKDGPYGPYGRDGRDGQMISRRLRLLDVFCEGAGGTFYGLKMPPRRRVNLLLNFFLWCP